ncbi:MAG: PEP-CTERM sorting domain-containing protein [Pseudomonadota bacterium]|nr:PEP-CTERM sorting domain-containing protein [Pseudomonadota bacterium]
MYSRLLFLIAAATVASSALAEPMVCVEGILVDGCANGSGITPAGTTPIGNWGIKSEESGTYHFSPFGPYDSYLEADLATGVLRQRLNFSGGNDTYALNSYLYLSEDVTFHGSGSAQLNIDLTGLFSGNAHPTYYNFYTFTVSAFEMAPNGVDYTGKQITGSFDLRNQFSGDVNLGENCGSTWDLGSVGCVLTSKASNDINLTLSLIFPDIYDGEKLNIVINTQAFAYDLNQGGVDFGHTARLGLTTSGGVTWDSASGLFLTVSDTPASTVPEPASVALLSAGLGLLAMVRRRRKTA